MHSNLFSNLQTFSLIGLGSRLCSFSSFANSFVSYYLVYIFIDIGILYRL